MKKIIFIIFVAFCFISCGKKSNNLPVTFESSLPDTPYDDSYADSLPLSTKRVAESWKGNGYNPEGPAFYEGVTTSVYSDMSNVVGNNPLTDKSVSSDSIPANVERKLRKNGSIQVVVTDLEEGTKAVESWTKQFNGYISNSYSSEYYVSYIVRIPSASFDAAMDTFGTIGKIKSKNITADDVTEQYYDLMTRLETKKVLREKYNQYLKKAENVKEMLEIERQLNNVISEIESMEGKMRLLTNQIDYSTISVTISMNSTSSASYYHVDGFSVKEMIYDIANFFVSLLEIIIYVVVYGIPILALVALVYWLLLGKIGLLKKLFAKLNGKSEKKS